MSDRLVALLEDAKRVAVEYTSLTGRPLGITGEVAEYEVSRLLGLELAEVRSAGFDAIERDGGGIKRIQVKGRRRPSTRAPWGRVGAIDLKKEFDSVMLVLLDEHYDTIEILEAPRSLIETHLIRPGSRARNERGQMAVSAFRALGSIRWSRPI